MHFAKHTLRDYDVTILPPLATVNKALNSRHAEWLWKWSSQHGLGPVTAHLLTPFPRPNPPLQTIRQSQRVPLVEAQGNL